MPSGADLENFAGKRIEIFNIKEGITDPATIAYNIYIDEDNEEASWDQLWDAFINDPRVSEVSALAIGGTYNDVMDGTDCRHEIGRLIADRGKLPALKHLYLGANDPMYDDSRILFGLPDITQLMLAYPQLETLRLYGWTHPSYNYNILSTSEAFRIGIMDSEALRSLSIATLELSGEIIHDLWHAHLPALEHLELWLDRIKITPLDTSPYSADDALSNLLNILAPLFSGKLFPQLSHLALCNSPYLDDLAIALAASPLMAQLKVLDLSLGKFTDRGAQALLDSPTLHLEKLVAVECETNESEHCSDEMLEKLRALPLETEIIPREGYAFESLDWFQI